MPQYNTASDFLIAVQNEIKWKRAKNIATQEIADHITDQCDTLRECSWLIKKQDHKHKSIASAVFRKCQQQKSGSIVLNDTTGFCLDYLLICFFKLRYAVKKYAAAATIKQQPTSNGDPFPISAMPTIVAITARRIINIRIFFKTIPPSSCS